MNKKTAMITGAYGGLGTCFAHIHAKQGGDLILVGRSQDKLDEQAFNMHKEYGIEVFTISADLALPDAAQMLYDTCKTKSYRVDYLINESDYYCFMEAVGSQITDPMLPITIASSDNIESFSPPIFAAYCNKNRYHTFWGKNAKSG